MNKLILIVLFACALYSCDSRFFYENNIAINKNIWQKSDPIVFEVDIQDTLQAYNMIINIRNSGKYAYSNLFLFIRSEFPNGDVYNDTIECMLAAPNGKWLGSGLGDIYQNEIMYKKGVRFPKQGTYYFRYEQGMRDELLDEILDMGLRIERSN